MDKLRLKNYRCLEDTGDIELRPITILLGANSSGKSSFIKYFPLLQQSIGTRVNGLFLWDGPYVDFKNFDNTVKDGQGEIIVEYQISSLPIITPFGRNHQTLNEVRVEMVLSRKDEYYDYLKKLTINYTNVNIAINYDINNHTCKINVNGIESSIFKKETIDIEYGNDLLPSLRFSLHENSYGIESSVSPSAAMEISKMRGNKRNNEFMGFFELESDRNLQIDRDKILESFKKNKENSNEQELERLTNIQLYFLTGRIIQSINAYFTEMAKNISYVLPLRSIMNRYYRFQNRDVDQIDPDGDNLAMFLNSLPRLRMDEFNKWLSLNFHFKIELHKSEGHVEIMIEEEGKELRNLVDVGFGYTQVLPIITIIWKSIYDKKKSRNVNIITPVTIAVEQPELHLHPRFQAHFAQMLAAVMGFCRKHGIKVRIIIETHSEVIVNKLGQLIDDSNSELRSEDVNVVLFNAQREGMEQYVHIAEFSTDGYLKEWPFGFFSDNVY